MIVWNDLYDIDFSVTHSESDHVQELYEKEVVTECVRLLNHICREVSIRSTHSKSGILLISNWIWISSLHANIKYQECRQNSLTRITYKFFIQKCLNKLGLCLLQPLYRTKTVELLQSFAFIGYQYWKKVQSQTGNNEYN